MFTKMVNKLPIKKKDAESVYLVSSFFSGLIFSLVFAANQLYRVQTVGLNPLQLVLVGTALEVTAFIFEIPTGVVADIFSRRLSVIIGTFLFGIGFLVEASVPIFGIIILAQVIWGTAWTFISGAHSAWITDEVGVKNVGPVFLRSSQLHRIGNLAGIPFFILLGNVSYRLPIFIGGLLFLGLGIFRLILMPETNFKPTPKEQRDTWKTGVNTFKDGLALVRIKPILLSFAIAAVFVGLYSEGYDRLSEAHLIGQFAFPQILSGGDPIILWFAAIRVVGLVLSLGSIEVVKRRVNTADNVRIAKILIILYGFISLGLLAFAFSKYFYLSIFSILLIDASRSLTGPLIDTFVNKYIPTSVRATMLSMTAQLDAVGQLIGGPIVGYVGNLRSTRAALTLSSTLLLPAIPLYRRMMRQAENSN
jgi:DHA3 family tetracycline resistance protein-like MFS transporter